MKILLLLFLFSVKNVSFSEEWINYAENNKKKYFFNSFKKYKNGDTVIFWDLHQLNVKRNNKYKSILFAAEYNCRKKTKRTLNQKKYMGSMGTGKIFYEKSEVTKWFNASIDGTIGKLYKYICE